VIWLRTFKANVCGISLVFCVSPLLGSIYFYGRYEFNNRPESIDMNAIVHQLAQAPVQQNLGHCSAAI